MNEDTITYTVTLRGPLQLEYLLTLLICEDDLDEESRHLSNEHDLRADVLDAVKAYKRVET